MQDRALWPSLLEDHCASPFLMVSAEVSPGVRRLELWEIQMQKGYDVKIQGKRWDGVGWEKGSSQDLWRQRGGTATLRHPRL